MEDGKPGEGAQTFATFLHSIPYTYGGKQGRHIRLTYDATGKNSGFMHLGCGLAVGLTGLAAGYCIGIVGDKGVRAYMEQSRIFVGMVLILIFGEVLGLYGYVVPSSLYPPPFLLATDTIVVYRQTATWIDVVD